MKNFTPERLKHNYNNNNEEFYRYIRLKAIQKENKYFVYNGRKVSHYSVKGYNGK